MSIESSLVIPGITSNEDLAEWILQNDVKLHPKLSIAKSQLGGIGLEFDGESTEDALEGEDLEVLRVPHKITLDYMLLLPVLESLKERDEGSLHKDQPLKESELIVNVLTVSEPSSETEILTCYIIAFVMLRNILSRGKYFRTSPLRVYDLYLDVLSKTQVLEYPHEDDGSDRFSSRLIEESRSCRYEYESLVESMEILYREKEVSPDFTSVISFETYSQMIKAVRSRTLEIPRGIDKEEEREIEEAIEKLDIGGDGRAREEEKQGENLENTNTKDAKDETDPTSGNRKDFVTNITLVPILDFANHLHNHNAYFDIDPETNSVLLKLKRSHIKEGKFEVTISYSPIESIAHFMRTYGFVPQIDPEDQEHYQLYELDLALEPEKQLIAKWLQIVPQVQLVLTASEVYINLHDSNLPLLFQDDIAYNNEWEKVALEEFKRVNNISDDADIDEAEIVQLVKHQEDVYDIIKGVPPIGVTIKGKTITDNLSFEITEVMVSRCVEYVVGICQDLLDHQGSQHESAKNTLSELARWKRKVLGLLIDNHAQGKQVLVPDRLSSSEWSDYQSAPRSLSLH